MIPEPDPRGNRPLPAPAAGRWPVHLALLLVTLSFGAAPVVAKVVLQEMPVMTLVLLRISLGAVALHVGRRRAARVPEKSVPSFGAELPRLIMLSLLGVVINQSGFFLGLSRTTPIHAIMIIQIITPVTLVLSILLGRERFAVQRLGGIALAFLGVGFLVAGDLSALRGGRFIGDLLILLNAVSYSCYLVAAQRTIQRLGALTVVRSIFTIGAILLAPFCVPALLATSWSRISLEAWIGVGVIVIFPTVVAYALNAWALKWATPTQVAIYIFVQPLVTSVLDLVLRGQVLDGRTAVAGGVIMGGVALASLTARRRPAALTAVAAPTPSSAAGSSSPSSSDPR